MGTIPEFQQQRLASSAVGTPGVDPSAGKIAGQIAEAAGGVADKSFDVAIKRSDALATAEANRRAIEFDMELENVREETKVEFKDNPKQGQIEFSNRGLELLNSKSGGENGKANRLFSIAGNASLGKEKKAFNTFRIGQEVVIAKDDIVDSNNLLASQANQIGKTDHSPDGLQKTFDLMDRSGVILGASAIVLGIDETQKLEKLGPQSILTGYMDSLIETNPEVALRHLKNPTVIQTFDNPDDILAFEDKAIARAEALDKKAVKELTKTQSKTHFNNILKINKDQSSISKDEVKRQVDEGEITGTQGIAEIKSIDASPTRVSVPAVRAEGKRLESLGELTNDWIAQNNDQLSVAHVNHFVDSLTTGVTSNPSYKAAIAAVDAEIDRSIFGIRTPEDDKLYADSAEAIRQAVIKENKNPMTVAEEQIRINKTLKSQQLQDKPANDLVTRWKRLNGGIITTQLIDKRTEELTRKIQNNSLSEDEQEQWAEAIETLSAEVTNDK